VDMPAWLERAAPTELAVFLGKTATPRKSGLFIRHLCRCFPELFPDPRSLAALDAADRYEAGEFRDNEFSAALLAAGMAVDRAQEDPNLGAADHWSAAARLADPRRSRPTSPVRSQPGGTTATYSPICGAPSSIVPARAARGRTRSPGRCGRCSSNTSATRSDPSPATRPG
jgi:hypothetical protein